MMVILKKHTLSKGLLLAFGLTIITGVTTVFAQDPGPSPAPPATVTPALPDTPFEYANIPLPPHLLAAQISAADNTPANNPVTNNGATLGRVLFYDKKLSVNDTIACASCHRQANGFSDPARFSAGFAGGLTGRNSMSLANARYFQPGRFFWDERAATLEAQTLQPIQSAVEMGLTLDELVNKLAATSYYPPLFEKAFGTPEITSERVSQALAQFVRAMVSYRTKYDQGVTVNFNNFSPQENMGRQIFFGRGRCAQCHTTDAFVATQSRNIGLELVLTDNGRGAITGNTADNGKFKAPSLRNIALSAPYMHDGRFASLAQVVEHYNSGVQNHPNLDPILRVGPGGQPRRLNLTQAEKDALVAFLNTLTDSALINDLKFSDPFIVFDETVYLPLILK